MNEHEYVDVDIIENGKVIGTFKCRHVTEKKTEKINEEKKKEKRTCCHWTEWERKAKELEDHLAEEVELHLHAEEYIKSLEAQIDKMKCCGNCAHLCECGIKGFEKCKNYDKWEIK